MPAERDRSSGRLQALHRIVGQDRRSIPHRPVSASDATFMVVELRNFNSVAYSMPY